MQVFFSFSKLFTNTRSFTVSNEKQTSCFSYCWLPTGNPSIKLNYFNTGHPEKAFCAQSSLRKQETIQSLNLVKVVHNKKKRFERL